MKSINFYNFNFVVLLNFEYKQNKELWKVTDVVSHNQSPAKVCSAASIKKNSNKILKAGTGKLVHNPLPDQYGK